MKLYTYFRAFLSASIWLLLLSCQYYAFGNDPKMTGKLPDENSTKHKQVFETVRNTGILEVKEQATTTVRNAQGAASEATEKSDRRSITSFIFGGDVETRNEGSNYCEKARLCSLNTDHNPDRCSCHSQCILFGDCCEDALHSNNSIVADRLPRTAYSCYLCNSPYAKAVNIITSCPEHYEIEVVEKACDRSRLILEDDPSLDSLCTPVTDGSTGLTYGNLFCAICWDANPEASESWLWSFECNNEKIGGRTQSTTTGLFRSTRNFSSAEENEISTLTYFKRKCKSSFVPPRKFSAPFTECDPTEIFTCPSTFNPTDDLVNLCHSSPFRRVYYNQVAYSNVYCLACNHIQDTRVSWSCLSLNETSNLQRKFAILVSSELCDIDERFLQSTIETDNLCNRLATCISRDRQSITCIGACPSPIVNGVGKCRQPNATSLCGFDKVLDDSSFACSYWSLFSADPLVVQLNATAAMCYSCVIDSIENYTRANGSLAVNVNGSRGFYSSVVSYVKEGLLSEFATVTAVSTLIPMENDGTWCSSQTLHWGVPLTTLLVSQCCLVVYCALYTVSERLRSFVGEIVLNQSIAFFFGGTFFAVRWITDYSPTVCRPLIMLVMYFYNAAFTWTSLFAIEVARALTVIVSRAHPNRVGRRRIAYYAVAWGSSLLVVLIGFAADELGLIIRPLYGQWQCWYGGNIGLFVFAVAPLAICQTIDVIVYIYVIVRLAVLEKQTRMARETRREKLLLSLKLVFAIGLPWAFSIAAAFKKLDWLHCAFKVTGSLQGTFILLIFVIKRDVLASIKCCLPRSDNRVTGVTSSSAADIMLTPKLSAEAPVLVTA